MLSLLIPIILTIIFVYAVDLKKEQLLPVIVAPTGICFILYVALYIGMQTNNMQDIEYLHYYVKKIRHDDAWNERVTVTKTRTVTDSNGHTHTQTYQTKKTVNHPEQWYAYLNNDKNVDISKSTYNNIVKLWNVPELYIDMHRDYYTKDGDRQEYVWDYNKKTIKPYTRKHHYINKLIGSDSQFKFNNISQKEAHVLGLYEYPEIVDNEQNPIIGYSKYVSKNNIYNIKSFNAIKGLENEVCTYILIYPNTSAAITEDQRAYWQGGNKNEFIICVGIDSLTNKVQWTECFSWQDDISLDVACKSYINHMDKLDIDKLSIWLNNNIHLWKRKEFKDFNYLTVGITDTQENVILIIISIVSILIFGVFYINIKKS